MTRRYALIVATVLLAGPLGAQTGSGDTAWAAGRYADARIAYERALERDPRSVRSLYRLGILASWDDHLDSALVLLRRARAIDSRDPDVRTAEAQVLAWRGQTAAAVALYDSVLADLPERHDALAGRARALAWNGQYGAADSAYRRLLLDNPDDPDANAGLAQVAYWRGDEASARAYARRALAAAPANRDALSVIRQLRASRQPSAEVTIDWNNDSDHNTNWFENVTLSAGVSGSVSVFASGGLQQSTDPTLSASRSRAEGGVRLSAGGARITAAAGARWLKPDGAAGRSEATYRASAALTPTAGMDVTASFAHLPLDETAFLIGSGLDIDAADAEIDVRAGRSTTASLGGGAAWISDGNRRGSLVAALTRTIHHRWFVGLYGRVLDYRQRGVGYFSPDRFGMAEARGGFSASSHGWSGRLSGGVGAQQTSGSAVQAEWHAESRLARRWGNAGSAEVFGGITNSVASSVSGAFRYRYAGLRITLAL